VTAVLFAMDLPGQATEQHTTIAHLLASDVGAQVGAALLFATLLGFALAIARVGFGWGLAALGVLGDPLSGLFLGPLTRMVNPLHKLAGGLWIGTLFMLVAAGIVPLLKSALTAERRAALVTALVRAFSPLALTSTAFLALFGVITAWRHLHVLSNLWTTPYGITLIVKLLAVGGVLALGAWNWRRQKPRLGSEAGAHGLRKSATGELAAAFVVLMITAVLVSLPSPRPPGAAAPEGPSPAGAPPAP
jgi:copper transport protein